MSEETRGAAYWRQRAMEAEALINSEEPEITPMDRPTPPPRNQPRAPQNPLEGLNLNAENLQRILGLVGKASKFMSTLSEQRNKMRTVEGVLETLDRLGIPYTSTPEEIIIKKADLGGSA